MRNPIQHEITFSEGWFLLINGEIPFYCDHGCTVADFAAARNLIGYNKKKTEFTSNSPMNPPKSEGMNLRREPMF